MAHIVYVDLSAKIEQWPKDSAIAISGDQGRAYLVPSAVKRRARDLLIEIHGRNTVRYRLLAVLVYLAVKENLYSIRQIVIDRDYAGNNAEATIKNVLLRLLRQELPDITGGFVRFENVKGSEADELARRVFNGKVKPTRVISWSEVENLLRK